MKHRTTRRTLWKNTWLQLITAAAFFIGMTLLLLPGASKFYLTKWLLENGADTAVIEKIRINPFTGRASLTGANVTQGKSTVLSDTEIEVGLNLMALFKKQIEIDKTVLNGVTLEIELDKDGRMRFGSYTTPPAPERPLEAAPEPSATPWIVLARQVNISNCSLHFKMPDLDLTLKIDKGLLNNFGTDPTDPAGSFTLNGSINNTPFTLDLKTLRIAPDIVVQGRIQVDGFELNNLEKFLKPYLGPFTGQASVDGTLLFKLADNDDLSVDYDGIISLAQGHIAGDSFSVQGAPVRWEKGKIRFELSDKKGIIIDVDGNLTGREIAVDIPAPVIKIREPEVDINGRVQVTINDEVTVDTCAGFSLRHTTFSMPPLLAEAADVRWQGKERCIAFNSGTTDRELSVRAQGELTANSPSFADQDDTVRLMVNGSSLSWNGEVSYLLGLTAQEPSIVQTSGRLAGKDLVLKQDDFMEFRQGGLTVDGKSKVTLASSRIRVNYDGSLNLDQTDLQMEAATGSGKTISWLGNGDLSLTTDKGLKLALAGALKGTELKAELRKAGLSLAQQSIAVTTEGSFATEQDTAITGTASLRSHGLTITEKSKKSPFVTLDQFTIDTINAPGGKQISIQQAAAENLAIEIDGAMPLQVTVPSIAINDLRTEDLATFNTAEVTMQSPVAVATKNKTTLAGLNTLKIHSIQAGPDNKITVKRVNFDNLFFLGTSTEDKNTVCRIGSARLSKIGWSPEQGTRGESLSFADLFCTLVRDQNGTFILNKELAAMGTREKQKERQKESTGQTSREINPGSNIRLDQVTLRGESGLHFEDYTLEVPFISDLAITTLQIKNIDSGTPEEPASIKLIGTVDKRAPLELSGTIAPFLTPPAAKMKMKLKNYPLANLSAYTVQSVGVALAGGQLKLKSKVKLKENTLDMSNEILLKKLETSTISKKLADKLDNQLPIPLDSALSLLRDSDGNITLDVPLSGPVDKLNVGISDILITALSKAIVPATSGYLMYTLGPYGALAYVGMKVGEKILEVRLPPVVFAPGKSTLPEKLDDYFDRLAKILQDKPAEDFQLCPKSSAWEFISDSKKETLDEKGLELSEQDKKKLMQLGQDRAQNIKDYLIRNYTVDKDRLLICITRIETEKSAKPRVDIQM